MTDPNAVPPSQLQHRSAVVRTLGSMPSWKRKLLGVSLVVGLAGAGGQAASTILKKHAPAQSGAVAPAPEGPTRTAPSPPGDSSGFVSGQPEASPTGAPTPN